MIYVFNKYDTIYFVILQGSRSITHTKTFIFPYIYIYSYFFSGKEVEGIECSERSILPHKNHRDKIAALIENNFSKPTVLSTIKLLQREDKNSCCKAVCDILKYLQKLSDVPQSYKNLLMEIRKDSPISIWLPSYSQSDSELLLNFLYEKTEIFNNFVETRKITYAFPYLTRLVKKFLQITPQNFYQIT